MKKENFKVGDWVKLPSIRPNNWNSGGQMDRYLGRTVQITAISTDTFKFDGYENWTFLLNEVTSVDSVNNTYEIF